MKLVKVFICLFLTLLSGFVIYLNPNMGAVVAAWLVGAISFLGLIFYMDNIR
jgi:hypothetical protein